MALRPTRGTVLDLIMVLGFSLGILAAFVWSLTNIVDKYLVRTYAPNGNIGGIVILSCFFPLSLVPVALFLSPEIYLPPLETILLVSSGMLMVIWLTFYLKALDVADTSVVMSLLMLAPLFGYVFSFFLLGETLSPMQVSLAALIVLGAIILSIDVHERAFRYSVFTFALIASGTMGLLHTLFKYVAVEEEFWSALTWRSVGMAIAGMIIFTFNAEARRMFRLFLQVSSARILGFNALNESLTVIGDTLFAFAILLAPLALIQTTEAYQPIFILIITTFAARFLSSHVAEDLSHRALLQKGTGMALVIIGSTVLLLGNA